MSSSSSTDLRTRCGSRLIEPAFPIVDGHFPSPSDLLHDASLSAYMSKHVPLESPAELKKRERVLTGLTKMFESWVVEVCLAKGYPPSIANAAGGKLFTSGSYRLGVHEPGADIDTVCVAPSMCDRNDFFTSLKEKLLANPDVTDLNAVEGAMVPIITFDWEKINIDLLFARLNVPSIPQNVDIDDDVVLAGVDSATEKSLNGPRVTNLIAKLVSGTDERYKSFLTVVRCVRKWAKARGLYSNKMGYLGGVNFNIMVAMVCQLYPNASPSSLLRKFFLVYNRWRWPDPVLLTKPFDSGYGQQVWSPFSSFASKQMMPIITPAYPSMNSSLSVSRQTLQIMHEELVRANGIVDTIWSDPASLTSTDGEQWSALFEPSDFFIAYPHYLALIITGANKSDLISWTGFIESRLRKLVSDLLGKSLPLSKLQLWPKKFDGCFAESSSMLTSAQRQNSVTYFIGFQVDRMRMRGDSLNVEAQIQNFKAFELVKFLPPLPGTDFLSKYFSVKSLPGVVFESVYEGGKGEGMKRRREKRDADPLRIEGRKVRMLMEMKAKLQAAKMAAEAKKLEEEEQKREKDKEGRGEDEEGDVGEKVVGGESEGEAAVEVESEEGIKGKDDGNEEGKGVVDDEESMSIDENENEDTNNTTTISSSSSSTIISAPDDETTQLENALDNIQGSTRTREEAELDRQRLLMGEFLGEGNDDNSEVNAELLARAGYAGGGGEVEVELAIGVPVWRKNNRRRRDRVTVKNGGYDDENDNGGYEDEMMADEVIHTKLPKKQFKITFKVPFANLGVIELDGNGLPIDKGDNNFQPLKRFDRGRVGFEFKLGERGVGYYRSGVAVVMPSNKID